MSDSSKLNTFTVIIPTWNRANILPKAIRSVLDQTYPHLELIVIDDGSTDNTQTVLKDFIDPRMRVIRHEKCRERVISWNEGMREATGDWICFLDSDDEFIFGYLEILNHNINAHPEYRMFHFGHLVHSLTGATIKSPFVDMREAPDGIGMAHFDTGKIGAGSFVFRRDCLEECGYLPEVDNIYDLSDWFGEKVKTYWAERKLPGSPPLYNRDDKWCGNPWGQDYVLAWLLTRKVKSKVLFIYPYIAYIRTEPWLYERATRSGTMGV